MPPDSPTVSRRSLLVEGASLLALLGTAGCDKPPASCNDVSTLTEAQKTARDSLGYEDTTMQPGKPCSKCSQYVPAEKVSQCGTCKVLPGPVHPNGYCRAFTPKS